MGSKNDQPLMEAATSMLHQLGVESEIQVVSAHRNPARTRDYALKARDRGVEVIIAGAGGAAHLPGVIASLTDLPVIGVPLATSDLKGVDALYSIVQMPSGVPVASVGIGGAKNAALLAARILALKYPKVAEAYRKYREELEGS
jgi:5-(carboxyamino)imidazole ribonucleotide mutase